MASELPRSWLDDLAERLRSTSAATPATLPVVHPKAPAARATPAAAGRRKRRRTFCYQPQCRVVALNRGRGHGAPHHPRRHRGNHLLLRALADHLGRGAGCDLPPDPWRPVECLDRYGRGMLALYRTVPDPSPRTWTSAGKGLSRLATRVRGGISPDSHT